MQPDPAAVTACRHSTSWMSPAAYTPSTLVLTPCWTCRPQHARNHFETPCTGRVICPSLARPYLGPCVRATCILAIAFLKPDLPADQSKQHCGLSLQGLTRSVGDADTHLDIALVIQLDLTFHKMAVWCVADAIEEPPDLQIPLLSCIRGQCVSQA